MRSRKDVSRKKTRSRRVNRLTQRENSMKKGGCLNKLRHPFPAVKGKYIWISRAAAIMGVHRSTIWNWGSTGDIILVRPQGFTHHHLVDVASLERWHAKLKSTLFL